ncbi:ligase-associated DNA damage response DEXH box helicase [Limnobacter sp.]|jgi:ATP-dependent helicase Lhr and Lhr-like helicase|uniref:ligase-associated DNA damage response DEXH box helicase n=1 Tax=Limnobacter sp. TaxID=2003368 RepID=UPI0027329373|nr:ligase-associated DNA damage response DEXH box helicase [Limnobacter sp.]MDP3273523.1 ligase-associated DNA damage response DEXH box helicase [Limnobacter sp.]
MSEFRGIPPGPNVGTQLKALRRKKKAADRAVNSAPAIVGQAPEVALHANRPPLSELTLTNLQEWFDAQGWQPFEYQLQVWKAFQKGHSGLLHATTGAGKTLAVWLGALLRLAQLPTPRGAATRVMWITPMRALAADSTKALQQSLSALAGDCDVALQTGDTDSAARAAILRKPPFALVTTPESLTLMFTRASSQPNLSKLQVLVVDEWHELIGNKRGVQLQLAIARLARINPGLQVWGLSATLGNLPVAMDVLLHPVKNHAKCTLVQGKLPKQLMIDSLIPDTFERFPWGGHLGLNQLEFVAREIDQSASTLVFTNTRSQAEIWYQALLEARPDYAGLLALHHGSLDKTVRDWVEQGLKNGSLKAVVCTSSLDLGVDFLPVERVIQIGSPKGVARLLQRAGRSGHAPGRPSRITVVPTHALELIEAAAARHAAQQKQIESRFSPQAPLDVLVQHLVTVAMGTGFKPDELFAEVCTTSAYENLSRTQFDWALAFVEKGGESLAAYPDYQRVAADDEGIYRVPRRDIARRHAMSVGTIVSDAAMHVAWMTGGRLGTIEEGFIARLKTGDCFSFAGRVLELVKVRDMTAYVRKANRKKATVPQWQGGKMPLSSELAYASLQMLELAHQAISSGKKTALPELQALESLLALQMRWSALPNTGNLLIEEMHSKEGHHLFVYPFEGRTVHIGLASLLAWRASRHKPGTFSIAMNDYGFELLSAEPVNWHEWIAGSLAQAPLFSTENLFEDVLACLNASELAQRRFREIARIAGLVFQGFPGAGKSAKQLQASSGLFFEVFKKHDQNNLLLDQAQREALEQELDLKRMEAALCAIHRKTLVFKSIDRPTPFAFPLLIERLRETVSTEKLSDRVARMVAELEKAAQV